MRRFDEIRCYEDERAESCVYEDEDDNWGEGCCEDELMDDDFYERDYCD